MTDRHHGYIVTLDHELRADDSEAIIQAIRMIKGVVDVAPVVADHETYMCEARVRQELGQKLFEILFPKKT